MNETKKQLAQTYNIHIEKVFCYYCKNWGFHNHKPLNHIGESYCRFYTHKVSAGCFCKKFEFMA